MAHDRRKAHHRNEPGLLSKDGERKPRKENPAEREKNDGMKMSRAKGDSER